eukprot:g70261.t1
MPLVLPLHTDDARIILNKLAKEISISQSPFSSSNVTTMQAMSLDATLQNLLKKVVSEDSNENDLSPASDSFSIFRAFLYTNDPLLNRAADALYARSSQVIEERSGSNFNFWRRVETAGSMETESMLWSHTANECEENFFSRSCPEFMEMEAFDRDTQVQPRVRFPDSTPTTPHHVPVAPIKSSPVRCSEDDLFRLGDLSISPSLSIMGDNFVDTKLIGQGTYGEVYRVRSLRDGKVYAVKRSIRAFQSSSERSRALSEVQAHLTLCDKARPHKRQRSWSESSQSDPNKIDNNIEQPDRPTQWLRDANEMEADECHLSGHPHCVQYYGHWEVNDHLFIQTEYFSRGTLKDRMLEERANETRIWQYISDLVLGLNHLHSCGLVHLDLKPDNIFVTAQGYLKIGDLGIATQADQIGLDRSEGGDFTYIAPEMLDNSLGRVGPKSDVFSLGLIAYEMAGDIVLPSSTGNHWDELRHNQAPGLLQPGDHGDHNALVATPQDVQDSEKLILRRGKKGPCHVTEGEGVDLINNPCARQLRVARDSRGCTRRCSVDSSPQSSDGHRSPMLDVDSDHEGCADEEGVFDLNLGEGPADSQVSSALAIHRKKQHGPDSQFSPSSFSFPLPSRYVSCSSSSSASSSDFSPQKQGRGSMLYATSSPRKTSRLPRTPHAQPSRECTGISLPHYPSQERNDTSLSHSSLSSLTDSAPSSIAETPETSPSHHPGRQSSPVRQLFRINDDVSPFASVPPFPISTPAGPRSQNASPFAILPAGGAGGSSTTTATTQSNNNFTPQNSFLSSESHGWCAPPPGRAAQSRPVQMPPRPEKSGIFPEKSSISASCADSSASASSSCWASLPRKNVPGRKELMDSSASAHLFKNISTDLQKLIAEMLQRNPKDRINILELLRHPILSLYLNEHFHHKPRDPVERSLDELDAGKKMSVFNCLLGGGPATAGARSKADLDQEMMPPPASVPVRDRSGSTSMLPNLSTPTTDPDRTLLRDRMPIPRTLSQPQHKQPPPSPHKSSPRNKSPVKPASRISSLLLPPTDSAGPVLPPRPRPATRINSSPTTWGASQADSSPTSRIRRAKNGRFSSCRLVRMHSVPAKNGAQPNASKILTFQVSDNLSPPSQSFALEDTAMMLYSPPMASRPCLAASMSSQGQLFGPADPARSHGPAGTDEPSRRDRLSSPPKSCSKAQRTSSADFTSPTVRALDNLSAQHLSDVRSKVNMETAIRAQFGQGLLDGIRLAVHGDLEDEEKNVSSPLAIGPGMASQHASNGTTDSRDLHADHTSKQVCVYVLSPAQSRPNSPRKHMQIHRHQFRPKSHPDSQQAARVWLAGRHESTNSPYGPSGKPAS